MGQLPLGGTDVSGGMDTMPASPSTKYVCSSVWLLLFEMQMICDCTHFLPCSEKTELNTMQSCSLRCPFPLNSGSLSLSSRSLRGPVSFLSLRAPPLQLLFLHHPLDRVSKELIDLQQREHLPSHASQDIQFFNSAEKAKALVILLSAKAHSAYSLRSYLFPFLSAMAHYMTK